MAVSILDWVVKIWHVLLATQYRNTCLKLITVLFIGCKLINAYSVTGNSINLKMFLDTESFTIVCNTHTPGTMEYKFYKSEEGRKGLVTKQTVVLIEETKPQNKISVKLPAETNMDSFLAAVSILDWVVKIWQDYWQRNTGILVLS